MIILAATGHRSDKLGGYYPNKISEYVAYEAEKIITNISPAQIISGMALGFDQIVAEVAIKLGIPLIAAVPFAGQEKMWPETSQRKYNKLLSQAVEVVIVSPGGYAAYKMQTRNCWMADRCNLLLACWDESPGGTANCIDYAKSIGRDIIYIDPRLAIL